MKYIGDISEYIKNSYFFNNETPVIMVAHGIVIGWFSYLIMTYLLRVDNKKAEARSILIFLIFSLYFVLFGLRYPNKFNNFLI